MVVTNGIILTHSSSVEAVVSVVMNTYTEIDKVPLNISFSAHLMGKVCGSGVRISNPS